MKTRRQRNRRKIRKNRKTRKTRKIHRGGVRGIKGALAAAALLSGATANPTVAPNRYALTNYKVSKNLQNLYSGSQGRLINAVPSYTPSVTYNPSVTPSYLPSTTYNPSVTPSYLTSYEYANGSTYNANSTALIDPSIIPNLQPSYGVNIANPVTPASVQSDLERIHKEFIENPIEYRKFIQTTIETVNKKKLNEVYAIGAHNTLTYKSRKIGSRNIATPNQMYDFNGMVRIAMDRTEPFIVMWDFDLYKDSKTGTLFTTHGGEKGRYLNTSNQDISVVLQNVTDASLKAPHMIQFLRSENYITAEDFMTVVPESMKSRVGVLKYGEEFPTVEEVVASGKNIFIFFQNNVKNLNTETALYDGVDTPIHAQDRYFWRLKWDKMDCITQSVLSKDCMLVDNAEHLRGKSAFVLADAYTSLLGGNTGRHTKTIEQMADIVNVAIPNAIKMGREYGINLPEGGGIVLRDFITTVDYASMSIINTIPISNQDIIRDIVSSVTPTYNVIASKEASAIIGKVALLDPYLLIVKGRGKQIVADDIRSLGLSLGTFAMIGYLIRKAYTYVKGKRT